MTRIMVAPLSATGARPPGPPWGADATSNLAVTTTVGGERLRAALLYDRLGDEWELRFRLGPSSTHLVELGASLPVAMDYDASKRTCGTGIIERIEVGSHGADVFVRGSGALKPWPS